MITFKEFKSVIEFVETESIATDLTNEELKKEYRIYCEKQKEKDGDIDKNGYLHKGFHFKRIKFPSSYREKAFYKHWKEENTAEIKSRMNFGGGALQDLFAKQRTGHMCFDGWKLKITNKDKFIVATVMQWLGTNCGWCFLVETLKDCGYKVVMTEDGKKMSRESLEKSLNYKSKK